ncbi:hypothetical protein KGM_206456A, partial [Danaus plexippus plexippus]
MAHLLRSVYILGVGKDYE